MKPDKNVRTSSSEQQMIAPQLHCHTTLAQCCVTMQCPSYRVKLIQHLHVKPTL